MPEESDLRLSPAQELLLRRRLSARRTGNAPHAASVARDERPALSFSQQRLWFLDRLLPGNTAYNVSVAYRVLGPLDAWALAKALPHIVDRHEILRTHYEIGDGTPYQVVEAPGGFRLSELDVSQDLDSSARAREAVDRAADSPFDLARGPVLRVLLIRLAPDDHVLALVVHHIAFDRESLQIFAFELTEAYAAFHAGGALDLPALRWQYADFAAWQHVACPPRVLDGQFAYWRRRLAGAPPALAFPSDHARPALPSHRADSVTVAVSSKAAASLSLLARQHGLTMFAITMAAYHGVLSRYTGIPDIVVGCAINGRPRMRSAGLIGFFANSVPIRADTSGDPAFVEFARQVHDTVLDAHENQDLPFEHLVERLRPERDLSRYPIIQSWFDCVSTGSAADHVVPALTGAQVMPFPTARVRSRFDMEAYFFHAGDGDLSGRVIYATDLFERATMLRFASHLVNFLEGAAADPGQPLSRVEMLDARERHQIIEEWGTAAAAQR
jgi:Condensation domain